MLQNALFFVLGGVVVISALCVIYFRNPIYSALALVTALFAVAGLFIILEAYFVAAVQVIVYAGAIMVLFLFVIMLLNLGDEESLEDRLSWAKRVAVVIASLFFAEVFYITIKLVGSVNAPKVTSGQPVGDPKTIGELLFTKFLLPFEVASLILLAALIGVITLVHRRSDERSHTSSDT